MLINSVLDQRLLHGIVTISEQLKISNRLKMIDLTIKLNNFDPHHLSDKEKLQKDLDEIKKDMD